jgi:hypothetical protein
MKPNKLAIAFALVLSGCGTAHPMDCLTGFLAWDDCPAGSAGYERRVGAEAADDATCRSYSLQSGTEAYANCRQTFAVHREDNNRAILSTIVSNAAKVTVPPPVNLHPYVAPPPAQPKNCISNVVGTSVYTNCY